MGDHSLPTDPTAVTPATQTEHPWRATVRTVFAFLVGFLPLLPVIVSSSGIPESTPGIAGALAISAAVTRVLALPAVNDFLHTWVPWLAADPRP